jgi:hypothetical protein
VILKTLKAFNFLSPPARLGAMNISTPLNYGVVELCPHLALKHSLSKNIFINFSFSIVENKKSFTFARRF